MNVVTMKMSFKSEARGARMNMEGWATMRTRVFSFSVIKDDNRACDCCCNQ